MATETIPTNMTSDERDAVAEGLFQRAEHEIMTNQETRVLVMAHIDDRMYDWLRRLQIWGMTDAKAQFRAQAYSDKINVMWFTLVGLLRDPRNDREWQREVHSEIDMILIVGLVKQFKTAFDMFERLYLPERH